MTRELTTGKLYEIRGWQSIPAGMFPTISFKGVGGIVSVYGCNKKPASLSEMITELIDNVEADTNFQVAGMVKYMAFSGGPITEIIASPYLSFQDLGTIT